MLFLSPLLGLPRALLNGALALALFLFTRPGGWLAACALILIAVKVFFPAEP